MPERPVLVPGRLDGHRTPAPTVQFLCHFARPRVAHATRTLLACACSRTRERPCRQAGGTPTAVCSRWIPLQHVQDEIYFCNIKMKHVQHMYETVEIFATYVYNICKNT